MIKVVRQSTGSRQERVNLFTPGAYSSSGNLCKYPANESIFLEIVDLLPLRLYNHASDNYQK